MILLDRHREVLDHLLHTSNIGQRHNKDRRSHTMHIMTCRWHTCHKVCKIPVSVRDQKNWKFHPVRTMMSKGKTGASCHIAYKRSSYWTWPWRAPSNLAESISWWHTKNCTCFWPQRRFWQVRKGMSILNRLFLKCQENTRCRICTCRSKMKCLDPSRLSGCFLSRKLLVCSLDSNTQPRCKCTFHQSE